MREQRTDSGNAGRPDDGRLRDADRSLAGELFVSDEAYQNLLVLCDECGSRFGGTEGERKACDFILEKMRAYGLEDVHAEAFPYAGWVRGRASLQALTPVEKEFPCVSLPYTKAATVEGDLVNLGEGAPSDYERLADQIRGNLVLVSTRAPRFFRRPMHRGEKYGRAVAAGAAGFIWMKDDPGLLEETGSIRFNREAEIPGVGVSKETGEALLRLARRGPVRVRLETTDQVHPMTSWNLVGQLTGTRWPERVLVVGAHFDGHDIAQGAMDDASGAVVVLEGARGLARCRDLLGATVRFILFPLEEMGLIGAHAYVDAHRGEVGRFAFMLNLDGAGREGDKFFALQGCPELKEPMEAALRDMKQPLPVGNRPGLYSDFYPFMLAGVPSATISGFTSGPGAGRGFGHTAADTVDKVSARGLQMDAILVGRLMLRLAAVDPWPGRHRAWPEIKETLAAEDLLEPLRYEGRYPFPE
ncbi:MAG: M28 family peptidase [Bacillota bacterium]|nr:M28 family peptidase [Bacillota bacterium]